MTRVYGAAGKKGFTLVEGMIAAVIAGIVLTTFLYAVSSARIMLKNLNYRLRAINIAQAEIEDVKAQGNEGIDMGDYDPFRRQRVIIDEGPTRRANDDVHAVMRTFVTEVEDPPLNGKKIVVEIRWEFMGRARMELMETVVYSFIR